MSKETIAFTVAKRILADGLWHDYAQTVYKVSQEIPPNQAIHFGELQRQRMYKARKGKDKPVPPRVVPLSLDQQVLYGARVLTRRALLNNGRIEHGRVRDTGQRVLRLRTHLVEPPQSNIPGEIDRILTRPGRPIPLALLPIEEQKRREAERVRNLKQAWYDARGLDPATHVTQEERDRERKKKYANMTPEEKFAWRSEIAKRGWVTMKKRKEENNGNEQIPPESGSSS